MLTLRTVLAICVLAACAGAVRAGAPTLSRDETLNLPPAEVIHRTLDGLGDLALIAPPPASVSGIWLTDVTLLIRPRGTVFANVCLRDSVIVHFRPSSPLEATPQSLTTATPTSVAGADATHSYLLLGRPPASFFAGDPFGRTPLALDAECGQVAADDGRFFNAPGAREASIGGALLYAAVDAARTNAPLAQSCERALKGCVASLAAAEPSHIQSITRCGLDWRRGINSCWDVSVSDRIWRLSTKGAYQLARIEVAPQMAMVVTELAAPAAPR